jgi:DNA-binding protein HU-beta
MNKGDLVSQIAESTGLNKTQAADALNAVVDSISTALRNGDKVGISGFGTFSVATRAERVARNPKTGESVTVAEKRAVKFKPGKDLAANLYQ